MKNIIWIFGLLFFSLVSYSQQLEIKFLGNASFSLTDGNFTLVSDYPYQSGYSGYMTYDFEGTRPHGDILSIITHSHPDHFEASLFEQTDWVLLAPKDIIADLNEDRRLKIEDYVEYKEVKIWPVRTPHASLEHYSFLVEWHGIRLYFTGDTESTAALNLADGVDLLFITPWLYRKAVREKKLPNTRELIIYHHKINESVSCRNCKQLKQGEKIKVVAESAKKLK